MASTTSSGKSLDKIELQQLDPQELKTWIKTQALDKIYTDQATKLEESTIKNYELIRSELVKKYGNTMGEQFFKNFREEFESSGKISSVPCGFLIMFI